MTTEQLPIRMTGHVLIKDDLGEVLLDQYNAIHPQNMARAIARALANEANSTVYRIAFGNGGTSVDAAFTVNYKSPNTGQNSEVNQTYDTRLYNETYSEVVDEQSSALGTDPGSSDETGTRVGGGAAPDQDTPGSVKVISQEVGFTSIVEVTAVLNTSEPRGQQNNQETDTESVFVFDELGLYTAGAPARPSAGSVDIDVGTRSAQDDSGLQPDQQYSFRFQFGSSGSFTTITFTPPTGGGTGISSGTGNEITYGDLCEAINTGDSSWGFTSSPLGDSKLLITSTGSSYNTLIGVNTNGFLRFQTDNTGENEFVDVKPGTSNDMIVALSTTSSSATILAPVSGENQGEQNSPTNTDREQERLLTHIIFAPVLKAENRTLIITYTLAIAVAPTVE